MNLFEEYRNHSDGSVRERASNWSIAVGLQSVDGLSVSDFLIEVACQEIEGKITINEAQELIDKHYKQMNINQNSYDIVPSDSEGSRRIVEYNKARRPELYK